MQSESEPEIKVKKLSEQGGKSRKAPWKGQLEMSQTGSQHYATRKSCCFLTWLILTGVVGEVFYRDACILES